jgi:cell wall-associated NlpC family hydrolase
MPPSSISARIMATAQRSSFSLKGPSVTLDPRINAVRGDLADVALADRWFAPHYAEPILRSVSVERLAVHETPDASSTMVSELLLGEGFDLLDVSGGWAWGYCAHDHYVGYVAADALSKSAPQPQMPPASDAIAVAETYLDTPYVWGGRSRAGIDCSGLVQVSLAAIGVAAPRDADLQMAALGTPLGVNEALQRGDLIFFPGHVGMMVDPSNLIHATRHWGKAVIEPLTDVIARVAADHDIPVLASKRITI